MKITQSSFGKLHDGREVNLFTLSNDQVTIKITNYGAIITSIETPDKQGNMANIVCGFDDLETYIGEAYLASYPYFGSIIGRFGNRIANGHLEIEGKTYEMAINNGPNHLHGGLEGFDKKLWDAEIIEEAGQVGVSLSYLSPDGEENYPGNLKGTCIYTLDKDNNFQIEYQAETDKTTVLNLTNHTYFNLNGGESDILDHYLEMTADKMTEMVDQIPTGKIVPVENTAFDFRKVKTIRQDMAGLPTGYDDCYVFDNEAGEMKRFGVLSEEKSGRTLEFFSTQPGMQLYTGYWNPELEIDGKTKFGSYSGVALETQHYPDSVHQADFPSTLLHPGEQYVQKTVYRFGVIV